MVMCGQFGFEGRNLSHLLQICDFYRSVKYLAVFCPVNIENLMNSKNFFDLLLFRYKYIRKNGTRLILKIVPKNLCFMPTPTRTKTMHSKTHTRKTSYLVDTIFVRIHDFLSRETSALEYTLDTVVY